MAVAVDPREDRQQADLPGQLRMLTPTLPTELRESLLLCLVEEMSYAEPAPQPFIPAGASPLGRCNGQAFSGLLFRG